MKDHLNRSSFLCLFLGKDFVPFANLLLSCLYLADWLFIYTRLLFSFCLCFYWAVLHFSLPFSLFSRFLLASSRLLAGVSLIYFPGIVLASKSIDAYCQHSNDCTNYLDVAFSSHRHFIILRHARQLYLNYFQASLF